jgi:predicted RNA-binding protein with PIN domain
MEYLLIDGYNVINAWGDIFDLKGSPLEDSREKLLNLISNYQGYKNSNIIVVFDAHMVKGSQEKIESFDNLTIVFTKENETADNYIEKFVYKLGNIHTVRVVTLDYLEQTMVLSNGGVRITPREFREEMRSVTGIGSRVREQKPQKANTIASHLSPEMLEILEKMRRSKQ